MNGTAGNPPEQNKNIECIDRPPETAVKKYTGTYELPCVLIEMGGTEFLYGKIRDTELWVGDLVIKKWGYETMVQFFTSTEFWSALIGALIGGFFSWFAAYYTIKKQRQLDEDQRRDGHMPLLRIELKEMKPNNNAFSVLGILDGKLLTSAIPDAETIYSFLCVSPDVAPAFRFRVSDVYAEPFGLVEWSSAFKPLPIQLLQSDTKLILFNYMDDIDRNINVIIRFEYTDVFGNDYVQDAIFQYYETEYDGRKRKVLEKREVFRPQLKKTSDGKKKDTISLKEIVDMMKGSW